MCLFCGMYFKYVVHQFLYQMVGQEQGWGPCNRKLMFRVYDYTDATRLFGKNFDKVYPKVSLAEGGEEPRRRNR